MYVTGPRDTRVRIALRIACVGVTLGAATGLLAPLLARLLIPLFQIALDLMQPQISTAMAVVNVQGQWMIELRPMTLETIALFGDKVLAPFVRLDPIRTHVDHSLLPLLLLATMVCAWPAHGVRERIERLVWAVAAALALTFATVPLYLAGRFDLEVARFIANNGGGMHRRPLVEAMVFMESGGRWLLPLLLAAVCILLGRRSQVGTSIEAPGLPRRPLEAMQTVFAPVSVDAPRSVYLPDASSRGHTA